MQKKNTEENQHEPAINVVAVFLIHNNVVYRIGQFKTTNHTIQQNLQDVYGRSLR